MTLQFQAAATLTRPSRFAPLFQDVVDIAQAALRRAGYVELRSLSCEFAAGVLTLHGRVPTFYLKQRAQAAVASVPGVVRIDNRLEVATSHESPDSRAAWTERELLVST